MCVIAICETIRLTDEQVGQMYTQNHSGGGVAYRDIVDGEAVVRWRKGLLRDEMLKANKELPFPYVLHFRNPSAGTSQSWLACHPFPVDEHATLGFEGVTKTPVLFHNGFWNDWKNKMQQIAIQGCLRVPSGPWSDSRGMAWASYYLGTGFLDLLDEKVCVFGPGEDDIEVFGTWQELKTTIDTVDHRILVSNKTWERPNYSVTDYRQTAATSTTRTTGQAGGTAQKETFPGGDGSFAARAHSGEAHQESISQRSEGTEQGSAENKEGQKRLRALMRPVTSDKPMMCSLCTKPTFAGDFKDHKFFCWQCWSVVIKSETNKNILGLCHKCKVVWSSSRLLKNDAFICNACWETNGRPDVYFGMKKDGILIERGSSD